MPSKKPRITVYCAPDEHAHIYRQAEKAKVSVSTYAKRVCLGYEVQSLTDQESILALLRLKAELGRLGGLLKHELKEQRLARTPAVTAIINEIADNKDIIMTKVRELSR